jgi:hypothetical protein
MPSTRIGLKLARSLPTCYRFVSALATNSQMWALVALSTYLDWMSGWFQRARDMHRVSE